MAFVRLCSTLKNKTKIINQYEINKKLIHSFLDWETTDKMTHTGQKWKRDDYRLVRFLGKSKEVNPNWAAYLIAENPPISVKERIISCDGGNGLKGHPKDKPGNHSCLYCGLRFLNNKCS